MYMWVDKVIVIIIVAKLIVGCIKDKSFLKCLFFYMTGFLKLIALIDPVDTICTNVKSE